MRLIDIEPIMMPNEAAISFRGKEAKLVTYILEELWGILCMTRIILILSDLHLYIFIDKDNVRRKTAEMSRDV